MVLIKEHLRKKFFGFYITFISLDGIFPGLIKGDDVIGGELACEFLFYYNVVTAERTFHGAKRLCGQNLTTTGTAAVDVHGLRIVFFAGSGICYIIIRCFSGRVRVVIGYIVLYIKLRITEGTFDLLGLRIKFHCPATGGAFIFV